MAAPDHELMKRAGRGDTAAFEVLVRRWEAPVGRLLTRFIGGVPHTGGEVEDLAQEVFLRVLTASGRYQNHCAFSTWLYRIVLNVARDAARRRARRRMPVGNHRPVSTDETPAEVIERKELTQLVAEAVQALPAKLREPLVLKHDGNLTFAEVADVLGLPASTVKSRVHAALIRLRTELKLRGLHSSE